ncbi:MAG: primosomal protein N' [Treponema sp.]|jgi:primosomal protein N' (replication factor Y)|nr:primosomal protein N' [Treponema sp.]
MAPYLDLVFDIPANQHFTYRNLAAPSPAKTPREAVPGKRAMAPFGKRDLLGYIVAEREEAPAGVDQASIREIRRVVDTECTFGAEDITLAEWIAAYYLCGLGEALAAMIPSGRRAGSSPTLHGAEEEIAPSPLELSDEQREALETITASAGSPAGIPTGSPAGIPTGSPAGGPGGAPMFYLYGITGSGKTEVFLRTAEEVLKQGKSVIYLVPEIALTHQTSEAIKARFGTLAATFHSGMSPGARLSEWMRARRGDLRIIIGPRSAVFAPLNNLGLIIIDEEHDGSYKSGNTPRYHARQVAMRRRAVSGALLLMGSATPSAEAWNLMENGRIRRLYLSRRLAGGKPPEITAVSLEGTEGCLTPRLKDEILTTARMGRQTILFLNRRGFAYFYHCPSCGFELTCKHCSVSLTWHKDRGRAICHYCGYSEVPPKACPACGSLEAGFRGFGTEMIEEELGRTFPQLRVRRVDADSVARGKSLEENLEMFRAGMVDILLGTQMVAKGLNVPGVRLVGVILADTGLHLPDFRAAERTFSLLVQVAGRAGRYFPDGKVIIQTLRMGDPVIEKSTALDVDGFFRAEIAQRRALNFPPFSRLIRLSFRSRDSTRVDKAAARFADLSRPLLPPGADILGPAECPIGIIAGNHRRHLILRGPDMGSLHGAARIALLRYNKGRDSRVYAEVDIDPVSLL